MQQQSVADSATRVKPAEISSSSEDNGSSDAEILERGHDLRQLHISNNESIDRTISSLDDSMSPLPSEEEKRSSHDLHPGWFVYDQLDVQEEMMANIARDKYETSYVYIAEDEIDSDGDQIPDIAFSDSDDDVSWSPGGCPPPADEAGAAETPARSCRARPARRAVRSKKSKGVNQRSVMRGHRLRGLPRRAERAVRDIEILRSVSEELQPFDTFFDFDSLSDLSVEEPEPQPEPENSDRPIFVLPKEANKIGGRRFKMARGITVDSGAADNVMPRRMMRRGMRVRSSEASRAGIHYVAANGSRIPNEGETDFSFQDAEGKKHGWCFQVANVNKVLASVSYMVDSGHRVTFDKCETTGVDLSFIVNKKTGDTVKMRRDRNVWIIDAFVDNDSDFKRQE